MDYLAQSTRFKISKVLRYMSLYGIRRTHMKVQGQLHMRRQYASPPIIRASRNPKQIVGIIGCGNYSFTTIAYFLNQKYGNVIGGCMDIERDRAASLAMSYKLPMYTTNVNEILNDDRIRLVFVASNHASHAEYAIQALERNKHVYIEKPHVVTYDQLHRLMRTAHNSKGRVFLGFNRPGSRFGRIIKQFLDSESGSGMYNWFIAGHDLEPDHWYFAPEEGGRVLGNLCHWTDFVFRLISGNPFPVTITPTHAEQRDCDIAVTYTFGDGTIACITFSAKGHTFEGVRERFTAHKGNCLISMDDFKTLQVEVVAKKKRIHSWFRDHGHKHSIQSAYDSVMNDVPYERDRELSYISNTAWLFLKTREALETGTQITIDSYENSVIAEQEPSQIH